MSLQLDLFHEKLVLVGFAERLELKQNVADDVSLHLGLASLEDLLLAV